MEIMIALMSGLSFLPVIFTLQIIVHNHRRRRLQELELRPNCLLTRFPILLIAGQRSIFRPFHYWNEIPDYLREHGYEVIVLDPTGWRAPKAIEIIKAVATFDKRVHVVADATLESELTELAQASNVSIETLNLITYASGFQGTRHQKEITRSGVASETVSLKPLPIPITSLNLAESSNKLQVRSGCISTLSAAFFWAHKRFSFQNGKPVHPAANGHTLTYSWQLEGYFLDLAISLAERDARWSA